MPSYNKYVKFDKPAPPAGGIEAGLIAAAKKQSNVIAVLEDMGLPGASWFMENDRIVDVGIAEQNGAGVAAGLAASGFIPVVYSFWFAAVGRAYNQIRQSILVDRFNVKIIARAGAWGEWGVSHNTVEGIGASRVLPNLVIITPADAVEAKKATEAMFDYVGPVLLIQEASPAPLKVFTDDYPFNIGKAYVMREGRDATIIATGYMVTEAIGAVDLLEKEGLDVGIINMSTVKPLDNAAIIDAARSTGAIVTAENGTVVGGLGEGVAAVLAKNCPVPLEMVGVEDEFSQSGLITAEKDELKAHFALSAQDLVVSVKECIARKK